MALLKKLAALGAAAEAARRYAQKNPDKVRQFTDKAASFADKQTKGKYSNQINQAKHKVTEVAGVQNTPNVQNAPYHPAVPPNPISPADRSPYSAPGQERPSPFKRDA